MAAEAATACASADPDWRMTGVFAAAHLGDKARVIAALDDDDVSVVIEAVRGLAELEETSMRSRVMDLARDDQGDPDLRAEAAFALGMLGGTAAIPLLEQLQEDPDENVAQAAAFALEEVSAFAELDLTEDDGWDDEE
jgi:HEAT repeat protein